jgi:hypothetical protein
MKENYTGFTGRHVTDAQIEEVLAAVDEHGSNHAAAVALGVSIDTIKRRRKLAAERGLLGYKPVLPGFRVAKITTTPDGGEFIQQKPELGPEFEMPPGQVVKGVSALVDPDGRVVQQWIKTRAEDTTPHLVEALKQIFEAYAGKAELIPAPEHCDADLCSVYPIADQHNGLLAWGRETGESYDLNIGAARLRNTAARLISQSPSSKVGIILNLGDWQHTDDQKNMTPRSGNILDVDSRYFKILTIGVQLMQDVVELGLQRHEHIILRNLPGNHDPHASVALTVALSAFFRNNPRVTVLAEPSEYFFHRFGQTLIGATHGHRMKADRMAMMMAVRCREDWGATKYHWFLFGHIHHETVKEVGDVRVESFQTLASNDAHHDASGYTAGRSLTSITLHREDGEIGRHRINIAPPSLAPSNVKFFN